LNVPSAQNTNTNHSLTTSLNWNIKPTLINEPKNGSYLAIRGHVARSFWGRGGMILATI
jgi:hypothetical protein